MSLFVAVLFFVLTPGIVLSLPPKGSKVTVALTHAVVFALVFGLTHKLVYQYLYEGFADTKMPPNAAQREKMSKMLAQKPAMKKKEGFARKP